MNKMNNAGRLLVLLLAALMALSLAACGAKGVGKMGSEPKSLEEAVAMHKELMAEETAIFSENTALWEKVFMEADKGMAMVEDGKNYGEFLLDTIEGAKDQFTASERRLLRGEAKKIRDIESALTGPYAEMVRKHFMKLVPPTDHKFAALHGAVWSGGSFVYVPPGVSVEIPLQSYFRLNAPGAGQFEHTLIIVDKGAYLHFIEGCSAPKYNVANLHAGCVELFVGEGARLRYSTIENWSKNMYNLNTKRARVEKDGIMEWVSGSFGSHTSCLYPMTILKGENSRMEFTGITFAGNGQNLDTGAKVVHAAPHTTSHISTKSISRDGGISTFRSAVVAAPEAVGSKSAVSCESLMIDDRSRSDTIPVMDIRCDDVDVGHEAKIGRISEQAIFYLMSRGLSEDDARALIVGGFAEPIAKELPLEYAVEMNNLIHLEMKGSIG